MTNFLLQLLGAWGDRAGSIAWDKTRFALHGSLTFGWFLIILLLLAALAVFLYTRESSEISAVKRYALAAVRILFFALILGLLLRPVMTLTLAGSIRQSLLVLIDTSSSMQIADLRLAPEDLKRAAIGTGAIDPARGLDQNLESVPAGADRIPRIELVKSVLTNSKLDLLNRLSRDYDIVPFTFNSELREIGAQAAATEPAAPASPDAKPAPVDTSWPAQLTANAPSTALGEAIQEAIYRKRGQPVAGIFVATDGNSNSGVLPGEAAKVARSEGIPIYAYGVGISNPRDIIVANVFSQDVAFIRDEVTASVRIKSQGLKGQSAQVVLSLGNKQVDQQTVQFGDDGEQTVEMKFIPDQLGEFELTASIEPRADEVSKDNNSASHHLRVVDGRIKVLHIEQWPRFEYKFLQTQLLRDRRVEYKTLLLEAGQGAASSPRSPYLREFPTRREDLLNFDLVILGDVDPKRLGPQALQDLSDFVSKFGGSVAVMAGRNFMPKSYQHSALEKMLPVDIDASQLSSLSSSTRPIRMQLTPAGKESPMLRLSDNPDESAKLWSQFPPIYWDYRVASPKPGAQVFVVDPDPTKASRFGPMPLIALEQYGLGQVLWIGTDNLWRIRRNTNDVLYNRLWGQIVERMALSHMLGASKRTQLAIEKQDYTVGERVTVFARLYDRDFKPLTSPTLRGSLKLANGTGSEIGVILHQLPGQEAMYRAEFLAPAAGAYQLSVESDPDTTLPFVITEPKLEMGDTAMNEAGLRDVAATSGGLFLREEDLYSLPDKIHATSQPVFSSTDVELWSSPLYYLLLVLTASTEWLCRRLLQLR